jgi:Uma2 family endonuclease
MALADQKTTATDFEAFIAKHPDSLFELIHGEIVEKMPTPRHGRIAVNISTEIRIYLKSNPIGWVGAEVRHSHPDDDFNDRIPDISVHLEDNDDDAKAMSKMPAVAIEIKSPNDTYARMRAKATYYLEKGTQLVWLVYPEKKLVEVYRTVDDIDILTVEDTLLGYDILPDFELTVQEIFP